MEQDCEENLVKITDICRGCLTKTENMKYLLGDDPKTAELLSKFVAVVNFKVELGFKYPSYICAICEDKINASYSFQQQCNRSQDLIIEYLTTIDKPGLTSSNNIIGIDVDLADHSEPKLEKLNEESVIQQETEKAIEIYLDPAPANVKSETVQCTNPENLHSTFEIDEMKDEALEDDYFTFSDNFGNFVPKEVPAKKDPTQRMRLKQYAIEDVEKVIKIFKEKFYKHVVCNFCNFTASNNRSLSTHITRIHGSYKAKWCSSCNQVFDDLPKHFQNTHKDDLKCPFCFKVIAKMGHFMEHLASHSSERLHKCTICEKSFISLRHLKIHKETHISDNSNECKICNLKFLSAKSLRIHIRKHQKAKKAKESDVKKETNKIKKNLCPQCGKQFESTSKLGVHMRIHTGENPYMCQYCNKKVRNRNILIAHERTHTGEKPYVCSVCGKGFSQSSILKTHSRIHTGKPEQCTICDKRFCRPSHLRLHMRKHTGEKPYVCSDCGQGFKQKSHLVGHLKTHTDDRPYHCETCKRSFKTLSILKCHLQIHKGEKPFKCSQCAYACRQPYSLTKHMLQHDKDKPQSGHPHVCCLCQKGFTTNAHLTSHYRRFHPNFDLQLASETGNEQVKLSSDQDRVTEPQQNL